MIQRSSSEPSQLNQIRKNEMVNPPIVCDNHKPGYHKYFNDPRQKKCDTVRLEWRNEQGQRHREDGPAVIWPGGTQEWWRNGMLHREDGPAIVYSDGSMAWFRDGKLHREDGPAIIRPNSIQEWWLNGKRHREDGPAVIKSNGTQEWWLNGEQYF